MIHALKIHPEYFEEVIAGRKTFEVRENDRNFMMGDLLALNEYDQKKKEYTGRSCLVYVDYAWLDPNYVREGFAVMSIKPCLVRIFHHPMLDQDHDCCSYAVPLVPTPPISRSDWSCEEETEE